MQILLWNHRHCVSNSAALTYNSTSFRSYIFIPSLIEAQCLIYEQCFFRGRGGEAGVKDPTWRPLSLESWLPASEMPAIIRIQRKPGGGDPLGLKQTTSANSIKN